MAAPGDRAGSTPTSGRWWTIRGEKRGNKFAVYVPRAQFYDTITRPARDCRWRYTSMPLAIFFLIMIKQLSVSCLQQLSTFRYQLFTLHQLFFFSHSGTSFRIYIYIYFVDYLKKIKKKNYSVWEICSTNRRGRCDQPGLESDYQLIRERNEISFAR